MYSIITVKIFQKIINLVSYSDSIRCFFKNVEIFKSIKKKLAKPWIILLYFLVVSIVFASKKIITLA